MNKKSKTIRIVGIVGYVLLVINYYLYLEIYKRQVFGWFIALALFMGFILLRHFFWKNKRLWIRSLAFLGLLGLLVANGFLAAPPIRQVPATKGTDLSKTEIITVEQGQVQGLQNEAQTVDIFTGIPYAKAPVGDLRWKEPQAPESWEGVRTCDTFAPMAMQKRANPIINFGSMIVGYHELPVSFEDNYLEAMSEDCLYLNVWKPKDAKEGDKLPVLFYIHGGSLNSGQSYFYAYNGEALAEKGIIVVNISYRVGVFGYLADDELAAESPNGTTGNYGLLDQIAALQWVNDNIEAFGGDASNITIAGESAGASSVNAICVSPLAKGLFKRAVAESSGITAKTPYHTFRTLSDAKAVASDIKKEFNCSSIEELRQVPADELVLTQYQNNEMTVDGYAITEQPYLTYLAGNNNEEALFHGFNSNEADAFVMFSPMPTAKTYEEYLSKFVGDYAADLAKLWPADTDSEAKTNYKKLIGLAWFGYSHYTWSELLATSNHPVYLYEFSKENKSLGSWHAGELPYLYGNLKHNGNYDDSDYALSETMQSYLINFCKYGNPNGDGLPAWETYNLDSSKIMSFSEQVQMKKDSYVDTFKVIDKYMDTK